MSFAQQVKYRRRTVGGFVGVNVFVGGALPDLELFLQQFVRMFV